MYSDETKIESFDKKKALAIEKGEISENPSDEELATIKKIIINDNHFSFCFRGEFTDLAKDKLMLAQIFDLNQICVFLKMESSRLPIISYYSFTDKTEKQRQDPLSSPSRASSRFSEFAIYRVWNTDEDPHLSHELTHLISHKWSKPYLMSLDKIGIPGEIEMQSTSFWQEGLAHAVDELVFHKKPIGIDKYFVDDWCRKQMNNIPDLDKCINFDGFNAFSNELVCPFAGSLSKYLIQRFGIDKFREMYVEVKETNLPEINIKLMEIFFGLDIQNLLRDWKNTIIKLK